MAGAQRAAGGGAAVLTFKALHLDILGWAASQVCTPSSAPSPPDSLPSLQSITPLSGLRMCLCNKLPVLGLSKAPPALGDTGQHWAQDTGFSTCRGLWRLIGRAWLSFHLQCRSPTPMSHLDSCLGDQTSRAFLWQESGMGRTRSRRPEFKSGR